MPCQNCELRLFCAAELDFQSCTPELLLSCVCYSGTKELLLWDGHFLPASADISRFPKKAQL